MIRFILLICFVFKLSLSTATDFLNISFAEAQEIASKQNKNIFLYFTAKWCGPCKMMERNVFLNNTISTVLSSEYIALKIDVDTWTGEKLKKEFAVPAVPTMVIIDAQKKIARKHTGSMTTQAMLKFIEVEGVAPVLVTEVIKVREKTWAAKDQRQNHFLPEFGMTAGMARSMVNNYFQNGRIGYHAGMYLSLEKNRWLIRPGVNFVSRGGKTGTEVLRLNYLQIPVDIGLTVHKDAIFGLPGGIRLIGSPFIAFQLNQPDYQGFDYGVRAGIGTYVGQTSKLELLVLSESGFKPVLDGETSGKNHSISVAILFTL